MEPLGDKYYEADSLFQPPECTAMLMDWSIALYDIELSCN